MGDILSFSAGTALLIASALVMVAYWPRKNDLSTGGGVLGMAIFLGFLFAAVNTLYWQMIGNALVSYGWITVPTLRFWGDYFDIIVKGGSAIAGVLHLYAMKMKIEDDNERRTWRWWEMPWYPDRPKVLTVLTLPNRRKK